VLLIDDLQWADHDSMVLMRELRREPDAPRLLIVATSRPADKDENQRDADVRKSFTRIALPVLPHEDARALVASLLRRAGIDADAEALAREARGHPLFINEIVRHVSAHPQNDRRELHLEQAIRDRVDRLDLGERRILELVVLAGRPLAEAIVLHAAKLPADRFARALVSLENAHLVLRSRDRRRVTLEPYHDCVRQALSGGEAGDREQHRALAEALAQHAPDENELLAQHWLGAGEPVLAARYTRAAAEQAETAFAFDHAARLYRQALGLAGDGVDEKSAAIGRKLADVLTSAGLFYEAGEAYLALLRQPGVDERDLKRLAAQQFLISGHYDRGYSLAREVLAATGLRLPASSPRLILRLLWYRLRLRLRGLSFRARRDDQIPVEKLRLVDTLWSLGTPIGLIHPVLGAVLINRCLLEALACGAASRLPRLLGYEVGIGSAQRSGSQRSKTTMLGLAALTASTSDLETIGAYFWARAQWSFYAHEWAAAAGHADAGERIQRYLGKWTMPLSPLPVFATWSRHFLGLIKEESQRISLGERIALERNNFHAQCYYQMFIAGEHSLIRDRSDYLKHNAERLLAHYKGEHFTLNHFGIQFSLVQRELYCGDASAAHAMQAALWRSARRALLLRFDFVAIRALCLRAQTALAKAYRVQAERAALLREAERCVARLRRWRSGWVVAQASLLEGGIAELGGQHDRASACYRAAEAAFTAAQMRLCAAVARRHVARLVGGAEGQRRVQDVDDWMCAEGVIQPERIAWLHCPHAPGA
jgi:hypothetical protein